MIEVQQTGVACFDGLVTQNLKFKIVARGSGGGEGWGCGKRQTEVPRVSETQWVIYLECNVLIPKL